jgi:UDP-N-acetylglucosamine diphosphorylase/glucosamine-1-phosphate N-acetyltransferase
MYLCLFESADAAHLAPLVDLRGVAEVRGARYTLGEALASAFAHDGLVLHTRDAVAPVVAERHPHATVNALPRDAGVLFVSAHALPHPSWVNAVAGTVGSTEARTFMHGDTFIAAWCPNPSALPADLLASDALPLSPFGDIPTTDLGTVPCITRLWHLMDHLHDALARQLPDTPSQDAGSVHPSAIVQAPERVHVAPSAEICAGAILDASDGPIYVDAEATIYEQAVVRGPVYIGPKSQIKTGANIAASAFGTYSKVGGEVHDCIIQSYSNKGHMGFLGHSILGQWCNLGADTNTSNLKNDYGSVSLHDSAAGAFVDTGRQFMGLVMGDHSKCGINTMFNTGTVIGTSCNVYGGGFPPRWLPAFSWGSPEQGFTDYRLDKALEVAERVMARRSQPLTDAQRALLTHRFQETAPQRSALHPDG